jgi:hypothetical protein
VPLGSIPARGVQGGRIRAAGWASPTAASFALTHCWRETDSNLWFSQDHIGDPDLGRSQGGGLRFAADSPLEGTGFEPAVPSATGSGGLNTGRQPRQLWRRKHACRHRRDRCPRQTDIRRAGSNARNRRRSEPLLAGHEPIPGVTDRAHAEGASQPGKRRRCGASLIRRIISLIA